MEGNTNAHIRAILERDRIWSGYAIADLDPEYRKRCRWIVGKAAVILVYGGLEPPILFAQGDPTEISELAIEIEQGEYGYTLTGTFRAAVSHRLRITTEERMWRMTWKERQISQIPPGVDRLSEQDSEEIEGLFGDQADMPDAYHHEQLATGVFFGMRDRTGLLSIAGTHVISASSRIAAIGNVFTHPDHRRCGYGRLVSEAVLAVLQDRGIETVILNVGMNNEPAVSMYQNLGFMPYCGYYEGSGSIQPS